MTDSPSGRGPHDNDLPTPEDADVAGPLAELSAAGVAVWLDDISRDRLRTGNLAHLMRTHCVVGVTSNPTIFQKAIGAGSAYGDQLHDLAVRGVDVGEAVRAVTAADVRAACDVLRPAYEASGGVDGRVSIEVDPRLAHETERTVAEARALWWLVDRPNLFIKIPATLAGLPAITQVLSEGISVNVTLIFGLDRYEAVMDAFMSGVEGALAAGRDVTGLASVASFFVSRVDTEVDARLEKIGSDEAKALKGKAAVANARLAFERYERFFATPRWEALAAAGAKPQRPLWASTSTKDPSLPDTIYVIELITAGTVNTMPESTLKAFADHGVVPRGGVQSEHRSERQRVRSAAEDAAGVHSVVPGDTVRTRYDDAREVMARLAAAGIDMDGVVGVLEAEGVRKFEDSWNALLDTIAAQLREAGPGA